MAVEIHNERLFVEGPSTVSMTALRGPGSDHSDSAIRWCWLAAAAHVPRTEFVVVIVQQRYQAVQPDAIIGSAAPAYRGDGRAGIDSGLRGDHPGVGVEEKPLAPVTLKTES